MGNSSLSVLVERIDLYWSGALIRSGVLICIGALQLLASLVVIIANIVAVNTDCFVTIEDWVS